MKTIASLNTMLMLFISLMVAAPALKAGNDDGNSVIVEYTHFNNTLFSLCRKLIGMKARLGETETDCSSKIIVSIKRDYVGALKAAKKNGEVKSLLKKYREVMLNAVASIQPLTDERLISYEIRQDKAEAELVQIANRISMEL